MADLLFTYKSYLQDKRDRWPAFIRTAAEMDAVPVPADMEDAEENEPRSLNRDSYMKAIQLVSNAGLFDVADEQDLALLPDLIAATSRNPDEDPVKVFDLLKSAHPQRRWTQEQSSRRPPASTTARRPPAVQNSRLHWRGAH